MKIKDIIFFWVIVLMVISMLAIPVSLIAFIWNNNPVYLKILLTSIISFGALYIFLKVAEEVNKH